MMRRRALHLVVQLLWLTSCLAWLADAESGRERRMMSIMMKVKRNLDAIQELQNEVVAALDELRGLRDDIDTTTSGPALPQAQQECTGGVYAPDPRSSFGFASETVTMNNGHSMTYGYDTVFEQKHLFSAGSWLGVQSQQDPWDLVTIQQITWDVKPKVIYDIGTNVGGSAILFAHVMSQYAQPGEAVIVSVDPKNFTVNWDKEAQRLCPRCTPVADNPLWGQYVRYVQARAVERLALKALEAAIARFGGPVLISLDGWHRHAEVIKQCYVLSKYVTVGSYLILQDTKLDRITGKPGPRRAAHDFLRNNTDFVIDKSREAFLYTQHSDGYLLRVK